MPLSSAPAEVQAALTGSRQIPGRSAAMQAQATGTPQVSYEYDPVNGQLQYVFEAYPDKSTTVIEYDTENQNTWSEVIFDGNAAGQLTDMTVVNRNGTIYTNYYDTTMSGDPLSQVDFDNADRTWNATYYDTENKQSWSTAVFYYTAAAVLTNVTLILRNGSNEYQTYDTAHGDALQTDVTYAPGGAVSQWVYDTAGVNTWSRYLYDAQGAASVDQSIFYRSGAVEVKRWDVAHGDALQYDDTWSTNGTAHETRYDTAGVNNWSVLTTDWYVSGGQVQDQTFFERDGVSNSSFYTTTGRLTETVTVGAGGEKAIVWYNVGGGSTTQVFDEQNRLVYSGFLSANNSIAVATPAGWTLLGTTWYQSYSYGVTSFMDAKGDWEDRFSDSASKLAGIYDVYADKTTNITLVSTAPGVGLDTLTATFDANGNLRDVVEETTQGQSQNVVAITAAMVQQSLNQPGTLQFIEHGLDILLVHTTASNGVSESQVFWKDVSGNSSSTSMRADGTIATFTHYVGAFVGGFLNGLQTGVYGFVKGVVAGALVEASIPGPVGAVLGTAVAVYSTVKATDPGVTEGWSKGGQWGDQIGKAIEDSLSPSPPTPPSSFDPGGDVVNDDNSTVSIGGGISASYLPSHPVQLITHSGM